MHEENTKVDSREDWRRGRTDAIRKFLAEFAPSKHDDLLFQMMVTICRLAADDTERGDLKILNQALKELRYAFKIFRPYQDIPKVSIFGSARTAVDHPQYREAMKFAELIEREGWMVITGAGGGIMQAGHHGATRGASFGVSISLPFEQSANDVIADDPKLVNFKYFFTRKLIFVKEAKAIVLFPGGVGTQDEGFEALTLVQTLKSAPVPIVMCDAPGGTYWKRWRDYVSGELLRNGMIDEVDLHLFCVADRAETAVEEIKRFYHRYHSSRYVGDQMVIRLEHAISESALESINESFSDLLTSGQFEQQDGPLSGEGGVYPELSRLVFLFSRQSAGRLRMLIDCINECT